MTIAKFISFLDERALFFCRLDALSGQYEGSLPRWHRQAGPGNAAASLDSEEARRLRAFCYVNCWNMSDDESEALWRLYGTEQASVAIRTTYDALVGVARANPGVHAGMINYIDYEQDKGRITIDCFSRVMHKRKAFRHEEEVRLVKLLDAFFDVAAEIPEGPLGIPVPVDIDRMVRGIYIDPYSPDWFEKVVRALIDKFAPCLNDRVTWSSIKAEPIY